jgi:hypothetical protein
VVALQKVNGISDYRKEAGKEAMTNASILAGY